MHFNNWNKVGIDISSFHSLAMYFLRVIHTPGTVLGIKLGINCVKGSVLSSVNIYHPLFFTTQHLYLFLVFGELQSLLPSPEDEDAIAPR